MSFMDLVTEYGDWYVVETTAGTCVVPYDVVGSVDDPADLADYVEGEPQSFERVRGWCARYSAAGYMDCTEWCGPYSTEKEAAQECRDLNDEED